MQTLLAPLRIRTSRIRELVAARGRGGTVARACHHQHMRAAMRFLSFDPEPQSLPADPAEFMFLARMLVGPEDGPGEESFDVVVCTSEWIAKACKESGGIYDPRHHLIVDFDLFDHRLMRAWLSGKVSNVEAETWPAIGSILSRLGAWEFEDYRA